MIDGCNKKGMVEMLKKVYLRHEDTGQPVMVGYNVRDLISLEEMGFRIARSSENDFHKVRKRGGVYIKKEMLDGQEDTAFLYDYKGNLIGEAYKINK